MSFQDAKHEALKLLKNNWGEAIAINLIYSLLLGIIGICGGIGALLLGSILLIGYYSCLIHASNTNKFKLEHLFSGFKDDGLSNRILLSVIKNIYIFLWSLLFVIPGIIKSYSYFLAEFISMQHPDMTPTECLNESRRLMDGHKMNLFVLELSFIGWHILCLFTFGIGYFFLTPYINQTKIEYINANILEIKNI